MKNIVLINPLRAGKLDEYKAFMAEITGARKEEYVDMLKRYGLKESKVHYHKLGDVEFVVVTHEIEDYAFERLPAYPTSTCPFDIWFKEQSQKFYDSDIAKKAGQPQLILEFNPAD